MAMQGKQSNYDTDIFSNLIQWIEGHTSIKYTGLYQESAKSDIAMRVIVDHLRAVSFTIADGELPSNTGAGYVIRRILRRAVRYYYSFLNQKDPMLYLMVPQLALYFKDVFPELQAQHGFVSKVILEEEKSFLRTLDGGLKRIETLTVKNNILDGATTFELYDTYGFPIDLSRMIAAEKGWEIDEEGFNEALKEQKERGRKDAKREVGDWLELKHDSEVDFVGYDSNEVRNAHVIKYRTLRLKDKKVYQIVLDKTPFYAEGGGQVGDTGTLNFDGETINVFDTKKENDLIIHFVEKLPKKIEKPVLATIDINRRRLIENNHSATHLMHAALREVLGSHVHQKGSLVRDTELRFDFSHFQKLSDEEIKQIETRVNQKIRENIALEDLRSVPISEAQNAGAMMLFGEKYGDFVRMITFDKSYSRELCGGCHVNATGNIGYFKIISETGIAAGVRRIEAITSVATEQYLDSQLLELQAIKDVFKTGNNIVAQVESLAEENKALKKEIEKLMAANAGDMKADFIKKAKKINGKSLVVGTLSNMDSKTAKTLAYNVLSELKNGVVLFGLIADDKPQLLLAIDENLAKSELNAGTIIRTLAKEINGGGGGQAFFATAGGSKPEGLSNALKLIETML
jgi:alanyl-tRNA synthetase